MNLLFIAKGPNRTPVVVVGANNDRVVYHYDHEKRRHYGCVSRKFFEENYVKV